MKMIPIEDLVDITIISYSANPERLKDFIHEIQSERMRQVARILTKDCQPEEASPEARRLARLLQTRGLAESSSATEAVEPPVISERSFLGGGI